MRITTDSFIFTLKTWSIGPPARRARSEFSGSALEFGVLNHKSQAPNYK